LRQPGQVPSRPQGAQALLQQRRAGPPPRGGNPGEPEGEQEVLLRQEEQEVEERAVKHGAEISSIGPSQYAKRFMDFISDHVVTSSSQ